MLLAGTCATLAPQLFDPFHDCLIYRCHFTNHFSLFTLTIVQAWFSDIPRLEASGCQGSVNKTKHLGLVAEKHNGRVKTVSRDHPAQVCTCEYGYVERVIPGYYRASYRDFLKLRRESLIALQPTTWGSRSTYDASPWWVDRFLRVIPTGVLITLDYCCPHHYTPDDVRSIGLPIPMNPDFLTTFQKKTYSS